MLHEFKIPIYIARDKDQCYIRRSYTIKIMIYIKANKKKVGNCEIRTHSQSH